MTHSQRKEFFIAFDLLGLTRFENYLFLLFFFFFLFFLLLSLGYLKIFFFTDRIIQEHEENFLRYHLSNEEQTTKLVEVMRGWWATFGRNYQNSHLPLAK